MAWHRALQYLSVERHVHGGCAHFFNLSGVMAIRLLEVRMPERKRE
jgi:hypothetical protein